MDPGEHPFAGNPSGRSRPRRPARHCSVRHARKRRSRTHRGQTSRRERPGARPPRRPTVRSAAVEAVARCHRAEPPNRRLHVFYLCRENCVCREAVVDARHREAARGEIPRQVRSQAPIAKSPAASVQPDDHRRGFPGAAGKIEIGQQRLSLRRRVNEIVYPSDRGHTAPSRGSVVARQPMAGVFGVAGARGHSSGPYQSCLDEQPRCAGAFPAATTERPLWLSTHSPLESVRFQSSGAPE